MHFCSQMDSIRGNRIKISLMPLFSHWCERLKQKQMQKKGSTLAHTHFIDTINPFSTNFIDERRIREVTSHIEHKFSNNSCLPAALFFTIIIQRTKLKRSVPKISKQIDYCYDDSLCVSPGCFDNFRQYLIRKWIDEIKYTRRWLCTAIKTPEWHQIVSHMISLAVRYRIASHQIINLDVHFWRGEKYSEFHVCVIITNKMKSK